MTLDQALQTRLFGPVHSADIDTLLRVVESKTHHGRPGVNAETKRWIAGELRLQFASDSSAQLLFATQLAYVDSVTLRSVASILLREHWSSDYDAVLPVALALANDDHWEVREWTASLWGRYLDDHFATAYPVLLDLASDPEINVRRAMIVATMSALDRKQPDRAGPILALLERSLPDSATYIKRNLGPFAIGSGVLRVYPEPTLDELDLWSQRDDAMTRWNIAMAGTAAAAAKHHDRILPILEQLASDERRAVRLAVRSALRTLNRRIPDVCEPVLNRLSRNPATNEIASHARS